MMTAHDTLTTLMITLTTLVMALTTARDRMRDWMREVEERGCAALRPHGGTLCLWYLCRLVTR